MGPVRSEHSNSQDITLSSRILLAVTSTGRPDTDKGAADTLGCSKDLAEDYYLFQGYLKQKSTIQPARGLLIAVLGG